MDAPWLMARGRRLLREFLQVGLDAVCPAHCPGCGATTEGLCRPCSRLLEVRAPPWCDRCGEPSGLLARPCPADHRRLRGLALARAPFRYRGAAGQMVRRLKFQRDDACQLFLARAMADAMRGWARGPGRRALVVAVPLHAAKRRRRGHDHAAGLAAAVAARIGLRYLPRVLRRTRDTLPQGDPRVTSRQTNVADAFAVRRGLAVRQRLVLLVDDVTTSGQTAQVCGRVLRDAGARGVALLTAAVSH